jgi:NADH-quinone oxidoreductase subunit G
MPKCVINGREVEFTPGQNLIEVAKKGGVNIPFFCYHPGLSIVAQCRMCLVEVEKMPKLQTACSTVATEGMVVKTQSPRVLQAQKSTMEFLLINHPLDCPICDKSGECDLQDNSYGHGDAY